MSTDKELLELAAKAAGIKFDTGACNGGGAGNTGFDMAGNAVLDWHNFKVWNPLTNDGDALRLAVKLRLDVSTCGRNAAQDEIQVGGAVRRTTFQPIVFPYDDPCAATRRAIVLAAAELGRMLA